MSENVPLTSSLLPPLLPLSPLIYTSSVFLLSGQKANLSFILRFFQLKLETHLLLCFPGLGLKHPVEGSCEMLVNCSTVHDSHTHNLMWCNYCLQSTETCFYFCNASVPQTTQSGFKTHVDIDLEWGGETLRLAWGRGGLTAVNLLLFPLQ